MLSEFIFRHVDKEASVKAVFQKDDRQIGMDYRPISIFNIFSKIYERVLLCQVLRFVDNLMSSFLSTYQPRYSTRHVLLRLIKKNREIILTKQSSRGNTYGLVENLNCLPLDL